MNFLTPHTFCFRLQVHRQIVRRPSRPKQGARGGVPAGRNTSVPTLSHVPSVHRSTWRRPRCSMCAATHAAPAPHAHTAALSRRHSRIPVPAVSARAHAPPLAPPTARAHAPRSVLAHQPALHTPRIVKLFSHRTYVERSVSGPSRGPETRVSRVPGVSRTNYFCVNL